MADTKKLDYIQALRGLAALGVVICHARYNMWGTPDWEFANRWMIWGAGGVDLFFIISGFIMVYTTRDSDGSADYLAGFAIKRFSKIWPPYMVAMVAYVYLGHGGWIYVSAHWIDWLKSIFFLPLDPNMPLYFGSNVMPLTVGWTLNYEVYFYLAFGACMLFGRLRWVALATWMAVTLIAIPAATGTLSLAVETKTGMQSAYTAMIMNPIIWNFVIGMLAAWLYFSPVKFPSARVAYAVLGAVLAIIAYAYVTGAANNYGPLGFGAYAAILFLALMMLSKSVDIRPPRILVALGNMSFTLYLVHEVVLAAWSVLFWNIGKPDLAAGWWFALLWVCSAVAVAAFTRNFMEATLYNGMRRFLSRLRAGQQVDTLPRGSTPI